MAWQFDVNNPEIAASDRVGSAWRGLIDLLVTNSWVVRGSGDGNAVFENTGDTGGPYDVHTSGATTWPEVGANTFSATAAWIRIKEPGASTREFIFQRSTVENYISIEVAPAGFDDTGVADANTPPTASGDSEVIFANNWGTTIQDLRWHAACESVAVNGVYSWYLFCTLQSTQVVSGVAWYDSLNNIVVGDPEPWVAFAVGTFPTYAVYNSISGAKGYRDYGGLGQQFAVMKGHGLEAGTDILIPGVAAQADGDERHMAPIYGNISIAAFKGTSAQFRYRGTSRSYPNTIDLAGADPRIYVGDLTLPWLQNEVPL